MTDNLARSLRVLLVEDDAGSAQIVAASLRRAPSSAYSLDSVQRLDEAIAAAGKEHYDAVLLDLNLPDSTGIETLRRFHNAHPRLATIVLTSTDSEDVLTEAALAGAQDYLLKSAIGPQILVRTIRYAYERCRIQETVRQAEREWRQTFASIADAVTVVDSDDTILRANAAMEAMFGTEGGSVVGRKCSEVMHGACAAPHDCLIACALSTGRRETCEFEQDGRWFSVTVDPIREPDDAAPAVVHSVADISERKRAEEHFRRHAEDMAVLSRSAILFVKLRPDENVHAIIADQLVEIVGSGCSVVVGDFTPDEGVFRPRAVAGPEERLAAAHRILGVDFLDIETPLTPAAIAALTSSRVQCLEGGPKAFLGDALPGDAAMVAQTIGSREVYLAGMAEESNVHGAVAIITGEQPPENLDLIESFLQQAAVALARRHAEEALQETELHLHQAQKMEAIGVLAGGIAHDFNNILGAIIGYTELALKKASGDSTQSHHLKQVIAAARRAADLVRHILMFSRQARTERRPTDVAAVVREALALLRPTLPSTITIVEQIGRDLGVVKADPTLVHQVLMNLCTNAAHAMRGLHGVMTVSLDNTELTPVDAAVLHDIQPGRFLRLAVSDTGIGMEPRVMERIFEPFFTTKPVGVGTGMGLSVVHGIVRSHGGAIRVTSELDKGSRFEVYLPLIGEIPGSGSGASDVDAPRGTERLLLVDDEQLLVEMGEEMLRDLGYRVTALNDSPTALERFRAAPDSFDVIVTDLTMPRLTGLQLAQACLAIRPDIAVVLCTGYSEDVPSSVARQAGIREYILKPLDRMSLATAIRRALGTASMASRAGEKT